MTKLNEVYFLTREKEMLERRLDELVEMIDAQASLTDYEPTGIHASGGTSDKTGELATNIVDTRLLIQEAILRINIAKLDTLKRVMLIESAEDRIIATLRAVDLMKWQEIADELGGSATAESVRKRFERIKYL